MLLTPPSRLRLKLHISIALVIFLSLACTAAPVQESTDIQHYSEGCYYNYNYYNEGDRILTNEPCLNCTCHNKMLMCYLRVCPFTKPIGHDCTIEKREDQCCPIITCPEVPVELVDNQESGTHLALPKKYGCTVNEKYYPEGAQVPSSPNKPCELCYCIHNRTSCIMQECTLHVNGCQPIYHRNVCCPVRYNCDHDEENELVFEDEMTTTVRPTPGFILTTTISPTESSECVHNGTIYSDGESIKSDQACEHCYCMRGDIVCAVQECKLPLDKQGANCTALPAEEGECCPSTYVCSDENEIAEPTGDGTIFKPEIKITTELPFAAGEQTTIETQAPGQDIHEGISEEDLQLQEHIDDKSEEEQKQDETDESNLLKGGVDAQEAEESKTTPAVIDEAKRPSEEHFATPIPEIEISVEQTTQKQDESAVTRFGEIATPAQIPSEEGTTPESIEEITQRGVTPSEEKKMPSLIHTDGRTTPEIIHDEDKTTPSIISPEEKTISPIISPEEKTTLAGIPSEEKTTPAGITSEEKTTPAEIPSEEKTTPIESATEAMPHLFDLEKDSTAIPKEATELFQTRFEQTTPESISYTQAPDFEENEIVPISIPGEGDCLVDEITYKNNTQVPPANACDNCICLSSVVICKKIKCEEPPSPNCRTVESDSESCCPTYECESKIDEGELYHEPTTKKYEDISIESTEELTTIPSIAAEDSSTEGDKALLPDLDQTAKPFDIPTTHEIGPEFQSESLMTVSPHKMEKEEEVTTTSPLAKSEDTLPEEIESTELRAGPEISHAETTEHPMIPEDKHELGEQVTTPVVLIPEDKGKEKEEEEQPSREGEFEFKPDKTEQEQKPFTTVSPFYGEEELRPTEKPAGGDLESHPVTEHEGIVEETISPVEHGAYPEEAQSKPVTEIYPEIQSTPTPEEFTEKPQQKPTAEESFEGEEELIPSPEKAKPEPTAEEPSEEEEQTKSTTEEPSEAEQPKPEELPKEQDEIESGISPEGYQTERPTEEPHIMAHVTKEAEYASTPVAPIDKESQTEEIISDDIHTSTESVLAPSSTVEPGAGSPLEEEKEVDGKPLHEPEEHEIFIPSEEGTTRTSELAEILEIGTTPTSYTGEFEGKSTEAPVHAHETVPSDKITTLWDELLLASTKATPTEDQKPEIVQEPELGQEPAIIKELDIGQELGVTQEPEVGEETGITYKPEGGLKSEIDQEPQITQEPEAAQEPETTHKPEIGLEPEAGLEPGAGLESEAGLEPEAGVEPATQKPEAEEEAEATQKPEAALVGEVGQEPEIDQETEATQKPKVAPELGATEEPEVTQEFAATGKPEADLELGAPHKPAAGEEGEVTQAPGATQKPESGEEPEATYKPEAEQDVGTTPKPGLEPEVGKEPEVTQELEAGQEPGATHKPEVGPEPGVGLEPEIEQDVGTTPKPGLEPEVGKEPEITQELEAGQEPGATHKPEVGPETGVGLEPEAGPESEADQELEAGLEPEATQEPGVTQAPEVSEELEPHKPEVGLEPEADLKAGTTQQPQIGQEPAVTYKPEAALEPEGGMEPVAGLEAEAVQEPEIVPEPEAGQELGATHKPMAGPESSLFEVGTTEEGFEVTTAPDSKLPSKDFSRKEESTVTTESSIEMKPFEVTGYPISEQPEIPFVGDLIKENATEGEHEKLDQEGETLEETLEEESLRRVTTEASVPEPTESVPEQAPEKMDDVKDSWKTSTTAEPTTVSEQISERIGDLAQPSSTSGPTTEPSQITEISHETTPEPHKAETFPTEISSETAETTQPSVHLMQPISTEKPEKEELTTEAADLITHPPSDKYTTETSTSGISKEQETYQHAEITTIVPPLDVSTTSKFNLSVEDFDQSTKDKTYQTTEEIGSFPETSPEPTKEVTELFERFDEGVANRSTPATISEGVMTTTPSLLEILSTEPPRGISSETQIPDKMVTEHLFGVPSSTETVEHAHDGEKVESMPQITEKPINATAEDESEKPESNQIPPQVQKQPTYGQLPAQYPSYSEDDYTEEDEGEVFGPGTCRYGGKLFVSAQQIPRDDPCDFCFCFRSDIICLQQSCPPPISGCHEEPIHGFCCPRYECPVSMGLDVNSTTTTTTSTTLPPHFLHHAYRGLPVKNGCHIQGKSYKVGDKIDSASGPCMHCSCGGDGQMKCEPKTCTPEPMLRQMIAVVASRRR